MVLKTAAIALTAVLTLTLTPVTPNPQPTGWLCQLLTCR